MEKILSMHIFTMPCLAFVLLLMTGCSTSLVHRPHIEKAELEQMTDRELQIRLNSIDTYLAKFTITSLDTDLVAPNRIRAGYKQLCSEEQFKIKGSNCKWQFDRLFNYKNELLDIFAILCSRNNYTECQKPVEDRHPLSKMDRRVRFDKSIVGTIPGAPLSSHTREVSLLPPTLH